MTFAQGPAVCRWQSRVLNPAACLALALTVFCPLVSEWEGAPGIRTLGSPLLHNVGGIFLFPVPEPLSGWGFTFLLRRVGKRKASRGPPSSGLPSEESSAERELPPFGHIHSSGAPEDLYLPKCSGSQSTHPFTRSLIHSGPLWATEHTGEQETPRLCPQGASGKVAKDAG